MPMRRYRTKLCTWSWTLYAKEICINIQCSFWRLLGWYWKELKRKAAGHGRNEPKPNVTFLSLSNDYLLLLCWYFQFFEIPICAKTSVMWQRRWIVAAMWKYVHNNLPNKWECLGTEKSSNILLYVHCTTYENKDAFGYKYSIDYYV